MNVFLNRISEFEDFCCLGSTEQSRIEEFEQLLGLVFSEDYKEYALKYGAASFDGHELTGICDSERLSVVTSTNRARAFYPHFPPNMYVVEEMLIDHVLSVQDSTGTVYSYGPDDQAKELASSLQEYIFPVKD